MMSGIGPPLRGPPCSGGRALFINGGNPAHNNPGLSLSSTCCWKVIAFHPLGIKNSPSVFFWLALSASSWVSGTGPNSLIRYWRVGWSGIPNLSFKLGSEAISRSTRPSSAAPTAWWSRSCHRFRESYREWSSNCSTANVFWPVREDDPTGSYNLPQWATNCFDRTQRSHRCQDWSWDCHRPDQPVYD